MVVGVMQRTVVIAALMVTVATSAYAESYTYLCRVPSEHKSYPVTLDIDSATLTWRGRTFRDLQEVEGCRVKYQAISDGDTAELCTATKGVADLKIGEASFDCELAHAVEQQPWAFMGLGASACADYAVNYGLLSRQGDKDLLLGFWSWAQGYMSATNSTKMNSGAQKQLNGISQQLQKAALHKYCVEHPTEPFAKAVFQLYRSLPDMPGQ